MECPVLILSGDVDIVTKLEASEAMYNMAPNAILNPISGVNHMGFLERSGQYNMPAIDFIVDCFTEAPRGPVVRALD